MPEISDADRARARSRAKTGRTISDTARDTIAKLLEGGSRKVSDADRRRVGKLLDELGKTISDADRARLMEKYIKRNDGGIAKKTRMF
jgi:hypothetical protein